VRAQSIGITLFLLFSAVATFGQGQGTTPAGIVITEVSIQGVSKSPTLIASLPCANNGEFYVSSAVLAMMPSTSTGTTVGNTAHRKQYHFREFQRARTRCGDSYV
jgi:hypothetical protein